VYSMRTANICSELLFPQERHLIMNLGSSCIPMSKQRLVQRCAFFCEEVECTHCYTYYCCKIAPRRRIICKHSSVSLLILALSEGRESRGASLNTLALFGKRCTCLLTRVHIIPSAHRAQFTRGLPVLLYFYKPRRLRRRDESISSGCVYIRLHAAQFALCRQEPGP
jgi:hypothetical protein